MSCRTQMIRNSWLPPFQSSCAGRRFRDRPASESPAGHLTAKPGQAEGQQFDRPKVHPLAQGIAHLEKANDPVRESLDHGNLETKPEIPDLGAERFAFAEQRLVAAGQRMQTLQQLCRCAVFCELFDGGSGLPKRIARQIDAIEIPVILATILKGLLICKAAHSASDAAQVEVLSP